MKQAKVLSETELSRLLRLISVGRYADRNRYAVMLSYLAGLRIGEIASLKIGDVFDHKTGEVRDRIILRAQNTKTKEVRSIIMGSKLTKESERYFMSFANMPKPEKPLLLTQKNTAFSPNTLCQLFNKLYIDAGILGGTSHSGRRWFITRLAHSGISAKVIMTLAGHKHLSTTQRYIEVNDEMLKAAVEVL
jgi:integrase/recombinase XerD